jgi:hypothetical protein
MFHASQQEVQFYVRRSNAWAAPSIVVFQDHSARGFSETFRHPDGLESSSYGLKVCVSKSFLV